MVGHELAGVEGEVFAVAYTSEGATMAGADEKGAIWVYDAVIGDPDDGRDRDAGATGPLRHTPDHLAGQRRGVEAALAGDDEVRTARLLTAWAAAVLFGDRRPGRAGS